LKLTGAGHRGFSSSGVSRSAFGSRLQATVADGRDADARIADACGWNPSPGIGSPANHPASGPPL